MSDAANPEILAALGKLDVKNDDHWTEQGAPRLDALGLKGIKREDVTASAPLFNRSNPVLGKVEEPKVEATVEAKLAYTEDDLELLEIEVADAEKACSEIEGQVTDAQRKLVHAQRKRDELLMIRQKHANPNANIEGIKMVLARGLAEREAKAELARELRTHGITAKLLEGRSALDASMQRRRGHGLGRPQHFATTQGS